MSGSNKIIHSQARQIIYSVYQFMKIEKEQDALKIPLSSLQERVAKACNVSVASVKRIVSEGNRKSPGERFKSPLKTLNKPSTSKGSVDEFEEEIIRKIIYSYTAIHNRRPTMKRIFESVKKETGIHFTGKIDSFRRLVKRMGFRWKKTKDNRKVLMEKFDIKAKRIEYLRKLRKYKKEGRPIIYTDETYIHSSHTVPKAWDDGKNKCLKVPVSKGRRLIILHAGGEAGFIPKALTIFKSGMKTGDYHDDMNNTNFVKWLKEKFIPNAPKKCVLVLDNASYHNALLEPIPNFSWKKDAMQKWLTERNIFHELKATKAELYSIIKMHKVGFKTYIIDKILAEHDILTLRLPPYHPELNPIEKIWALVKNEVAACNVTFKLDDVWKLTEKTFCEVTVDHWKNICANVTKVENEYIEREHSMDNVADLIINLGEDSSDSESEFSDNEADDDNDLGCKPIVV